MMYVTKSLKSTIMKNKLNISNYNIDYTLESFKNDDRND